MNMKWFEWLGAFLAIVVALAAGIALVVIIVSAVIAIGSGIFGVIAGAM